MKKKNIVILGITIILFIVLLLPDSEASSKEKLFPKITEKVDKIEIVHNQEEAILFFENDSWQLAGKVDHPAKANLINPILAFVEKDITGELVSSANVYSKYGLDKENSYQFNFYKNNEKVGFFTIGSNGNQRSSFYFIWQDDESIYQVSGNRFDFTRDFKGFIDTTIFKEKEDKVVKIILSKDDEEIVLTKNQKALSEEGKENSEKTTEIEWRDLNNNLYDLNKINDIINTMVSLEAEAFLDDKEKSDLSKMSYQFSLILDDNQELRLTLFNDEEKESVLALSNNDDKVFSLKEEEINRLIISSFDELKKQ